MRTQAGRSEWGCSSAYNIMGVHCSQHSSDRKEAALVRPSTGKSSYREKHYYPTGKRRNRVSTGCRKLVSDCFLIMWKTSNTMNTIGYIAFLARVVGFSITFISVNLVKVGCQLYNQAILIIITIFPQLMKFVQVKMANI